MNEERNEYLREWRDNDSYRKKHAEYMRKWRAENKDKISAINKRNRGKYPETHKKSIIEWRKKNKQKHGCHQYIEKSVNRGRIEKPDKCQKCGEKSTIEGHHPDYNNRSLVVWLCFRCHRELHELIRSAMR